MDPALCVRYGQEYGSVPVCTFFVAGENGVTGVRLKNNVQYTEHAYLR